MPQPSEFPLLFIGTSSIDRNATQQKLYFLSMELAKRGRKIAVCVPNSKDNLDFLAENAKGVESIVFPETNCISEINFKHKLVTSRKWAAVHSIGVGSRTLLRYNKHVNGAKIFYDFDERLSSISIFSKWRLTYIRWVENWMIARGAGFTCASRYLTNWVSHHRPDLSNGINYSPVAISAQEHKVDIEISRNIKNRFKDQKILMYLGSIKKLYQIDQLLDLAQRLSENRNDFIILICGDGEDLPHFREQSNVRGLTSFVHFEGRVSRALVASYLDAATILLFPFDNTLQNQARCPTKAFHYAAANRPLVTNSVGEVQRLFGELAFYYNQSDISDMVNACDRAIKASPSYQKTIPFRSLTWEDRADKYENWIQTLKIW